MKHPFYFSIVLLLALDGFESRLIAFDKTCQSLEQFHSQYGKVLEATLLPELTSKWNRQDPIYNLRLLTNYVAPEIQVMESVNNRRRVDVHLFLVEP